MPWLTDLASLLEPSGVVVDSSPTDEGSAEVERFLQRLAHPAGRVRVPTEPAVEQAA